MSYDPKINKMSGSLLTNAPSGGILLYGADPADEKKVKEDQILNEEVSASDDKLIQQNNTRKEL